MALPSQAARPMNISATKFSASRSSRSLSPRRAAGWGLLLVVMLGFTWWALSGKPGVNTPPTLTSEQAAAVNAITQSEPAEPVPTGVPIVSTPVRGPDPAPVLTMGASGAPNQPVQQLAATNSPPASPSDTVKANPETPISNTPSPGGAEPQAPATQSAPTGPATSPGGGNSGSVSAASPVAFLVSQGDALVAQGKPVEARDAYNRALFDARASDSDRSVLREKLAALAEAITFSPRVEPGDAMSETYAFQSGDRLVRLPYTKNLSVDWRLIARVNRIADPGRIGLNQRMKLIKGPFHAVVHKNSFRMDVFSNATDSAGNRIFVRSFAVGLGEHGSTPTGSFIVKPKSKLVNPKWVNPRTGEKFGADDPKNPIGERWIGLDGTDASTKLLSGYGIHGTIEPESIGQEKSMGCVRLVDRDVEFIYELLFEGASTVEIRP